MSAASPCWPSNTEIERIISEYGNTLLRLGFLYLGDAHLAQDALQDTLLKTAVNLSKFKGNSTEKTWITRIMINTCKNYRRTNWFKRVNPDASLNAIPAEPESKGDDSLIVAVMDLPPKYKEAILLFYYQQLKISEIAKMINKPESTVSVRLKRARELLKRHLKGEISVE